MDPLSDVLRLLRPQSSLSAGLAAEGAWGIDFGAPDGVKFNAIIKGGCWAMVEGAEPIELREGDCFLLTRSRPFVLASNLSVPRIPASAIYDVAKDNVASCNGDGDFFLIGGRFSFRADAAAMLFDALPPIIRVSAASANASVLRWALEVLASEFRERLPGGHLMSEQLAQVMLVQILRGYLASADNLAPGWLRALCDTRLSRALRAIHAAPSHPWTVAELAQNAGMSRSSFAEAFRQTVGQAPMEYITGWRMQLARDRLQRSADSVSSLALSLGYASESAFSTAFKRVTSQSPLQYRRQTREAPSAST